MEPQTDLIREMLLACPMADLQEICRRHHILVDNFSTAYKRPIADRILRKVRLSVLAEELETLESLRNFHPQSDVAVSRESFRIAEERKKALARNRGQERSAIWSVLGTLVGFAATFLAIAMADAFLNPPPAATTPSTPVPPATVAPMPPPTTVPPATVAPTTEATAPPATVAPAPSAMPDTTATTDGAETTRPPATDAPAPSATPTPAPTEATADGAASRADTPPTTTGLVTPPAGEGDALSIVASSLATEASAGTAPLSDATPPGTTTSKAPTPPVTEAAPPVGPPPEAPGPGAAPPRPAPPALPKTLIPPERCPRALLFDPLLAEKLASPAQRKAEIERLEGQIRSLSDTSHARTQLARLLFLEDRALAAHDHLKTALALDRFWGSTTRRAAEIRLLRCLVRAGRREEALSLLLVPPRDDDSQGLDEAARAELLIACGADEAAMEIVKKLLDREPDRPLVLLLEARIHLARGETTPAMRILRRLERPLVTLPVFHETYADAYAAIGDDHQARIHRRLANRLVSGG